MEFPAVPVVAAFGAPMASHITLKERDRKWGDGVCDRARSRSFRGAHGGGDPLEGAE